MGLFSKEACCFCGKEVGLMSRSKLSSGEYICTDCKYKTHPFLRVDHMNKQQVEDLMAEMQENEERFQSIQWRKTQRQHAGSTWIFYDNYDQGLFSLYTPETKKYPNHFVYNMTDVCPYDKARDGMPTRGIYTRQQIKDMITLTEKKDAGGNAEGWVLSIPYFRYDMKIETKFPAAMKADDVKYIHSTIQQIISSYNTSGVQNKKDLHEQNVYKTIGEAAKAVVKGQGAEGVAAAVQRGAERGQEIDQGKIKKKGLLARLFGK